MPWKYGGGLRAFPFRSTNACMDLPLAIISFSLLTTYTKDKRILIKDSKFTSILKSSPKLEGFIKLVLDGQYGKEPVNATPAQIQQILDAGAASLGITLSAKDYRDYAYVAVNAFQKEAVCHYLFLKPYFHGCCR